MSISSVNETPAFVLVLAFIDYISRSTFKFYFPRIAASSGVSDKIEGTSKLREERDTGRNSRAMIIHTGSHVGKQRHLKAKNRNMPIDLQIV